MFGFVKLATLGALLSGAKRRSFQRGFGVQGKGAAAPLSPASLCRIKISFLLLLALIARRIMFLAHGVSAHLNAMSVVYQAVEDAVGDGGVYAGPRNVDHSIS